MSGLILLSEIFQTGKYENTYSNSREWLRRRIRMCAWKGWKKVKTKFTNLVKLGIAKFQACQWANTRKSYWRIAKRPVLSRALNNKRIAERVYISLISYYNKVLIKL